MTDLRVVPDDDPGRDNGPATYFGAELKRYRETEGLTQEELAGKLGYARAKVSMIESGKRLPDPDFTGRCDQILHTSGALGRILPLLDRHDAYPRWFKPFTIMEAEASMIWGFESQTVPGLLQTEDYARDLLRSYYPPMTDGEVERQVQGRLRRQALLTRENPPLLWFVLCEGALRRTIGGREVFRAQLARLVEAVRDRRVKLQVLPFDRGAHAALSGKMEVLHLPEGKAVYVEAPGTARITTVDKEVAERSLAFHAVCEKALSTEESAAFITAIMGEL